MTAALTLQDLQPRTFTAPDGQTLPYRLYIPANYDATQKYPLVLFLHGAGERGEDNETQLRHTSCLNLIDLAHPAFFLAPQCPTGKQWVDTPWAEGSYSLAEVPISENLQLALDAVEAVREEFSIDPARLYISGMSMGGYGSWNALMQRPGLFAAAVIVCGGGDPLQTTHFQGTGIWAFHAAGDAVVPAHASRDMIQALWAAGQHPNYTEYTDASHNSWDRAYQTPGLTEWLYSFRR